MLSRCVVSQVKHNSYFLVGVLIGLWVALTAIPLDELPEPCESITPAPFSDEYEPQREEKPLGSGGQTGGRSVQRPRYYSTELGMRDSLLAGILSSEAMLNTRIAAINKTSSRLQPSLRFFITARALQAAPGRANVVGFTDTREMLKPFHALKYLADNYLEEYDFFFLASDSTFVNAQRLKELVSRLSVSQHVYMGKVLDDDSHYCSLEAGILLSNSVLRALHAELDWCVRNSYSARHHENVGRCVLHAAHLHCADTLQGETYSSVSLEPELQLVPALASAVTAYPVTDTAQYYQLHSYVSRVYLERIQSSISSLRSAIVRLAPRLPPAPPPPPAPGSAPAGSATPAPARAAVTWPLGLRDDVGLPPPKPNDRFDHLRWTSFNATHLFFPNDLLGAVRLAGAHRKALDLVVRHAEAWVRARMPRATRVRVAEGALRLRPATDLRYKLLLRVRGEGGEECLRQVEVARPLGATRLVPVPYVTESARACLVLPAAVGGAGGGAGEVEGFLRRYKATCLQGNANTALVVVLMHPPNENNSTTANAIRSQVSALSLAHRDAPIHLVETELAGAGGDAGRAAVAAAAARLGRRALVVLAAPAMEFSEEFLNRARMNVVCGVQWYSAVGFRRYALSAGGAGGRRGTGRFSPYERSVSAFCLEDYIAAAPLHPSLPIPSLLSLPSAPRCLRAPEPALVFPPRPPPAPPAARRLRARGFRGLELGPRHALAKLLLETEADVTS